MLPAAGKKVLPVSQNENGSKVFLVDLNSITEKTVLKYNSKKATLEFAMELTSLLPKKTSVNEGDSFVISFNAKASDDIENLRFEIFSGSLKEPVSIQEYTEYIVCEKALKDKIFKVNTKIGLARSAVKKIFLRFTCASQNKKQVTLYSCDENTDDEVLENEEISETQNETENFDGLENQDEQETVEELKNEQNDEEKDEQSENAEEAENSDQENLETELTEEEINKAEKAAKEQALNEMLEAAFKKDVERYKKEYLQDYALNDEPALPGDEDVDYGAIQNPDEADSFGRTLLMIAAKSGNDWQIKRLLQAGADVNKKDNDGWTALMYAARYQENLSAVKLIIDAGANVKQKNKFDSSALTLAAMYNNNPEIINTLLDYYTVSEKEVLRSLSLLLSTRQKNEYVQISKLNVFITRSIPLNTYYEGKTPLMYACQYGSSTKVIKVLLDNSAVTSIRSTEGKTAFDYAKENKNLRHDDIYWSLNRNN